MVIGTEQDVNAFVLFSPLIFGSREARIERRPGGLDNSISPRRHRFGPDNAAVSLATENAPVRLPRQVRRACRAVAQPPAPWPPAPGLADHRLIFLAAKPALRALSQTRLGLVMSVFERSAWNATRGSGSRGMAGMNMEVEGRGENMRALVTACDEVGEQLSPDELAVVRASGQLPEWFVAAVHARARAIRAYWRPA
jgi:hypothetical protein